MKQKNRLERKETVWNLHIFLHTAISSSSSKIFIKKSFQENKPLIGKNIIQIQTLITIPPCIIR